MSGNKKKLIAFNYFGGKFTYVDEITQYFPTHNHFVDVFGGSMAVTLNKPYSQVDTYNDLNGDIVNFFRVLRNRSHELIEQLLLTPIARDEFDCCFEPAADELERARRFYVLVRQSFFGLAVQRVNKGWHFVSKSSEAFHGETVSKWHNAIEKLWPVIDRLTHIQIENKCFRTLIPDVDHPTTLLYQDPPYPLESRASTNDYKHDFTNNDHIDLAELNNRAQSKIMVSGYECGLMKELYANDKWQMIRLKQRMNNIRTGKVQECIWINFPPPSQLTLFHQPASFAT